MIDKSKGVFLALAAIFIIIVVYFIVNYISYGTVLVKTIPGNAEVYSIKNNCYSPCKLRMPIGRQRIWSTKDDYDLSTVDVEVRRFKKGQVIITLEKVKDVYGGSVKTDVIPQEPAIKNLPYISDAFRVDWDQNTEKYLIVPVIPDEPEKSFEKQLADNWLIYETNAKAGIKWLKTKGLIVSKNNVEFWREQWWPQGVRIDIN